MTPEEILEKWQRADSYVRKTGRMGTNHEEYSLSDEDLLDLIHRAQREAVEKTLEHLVDEIIDGDELGYEIVEKLKNLTPEKVLGEG